MWSMYEHIAVHVDCFWNVNTDIVGPLLQLQGHQYCLTISVGMLKQNMVLSLINREK